MSSARRPACSRSTVRRPPPSPMLEQSCSYVMPRRRQAMASRSRNMKKFVSTLGIMRQPRWRRKVPPGRKELAIHAALLAGASLAGLERSSGLPPNKREHTSGHGAENAGAGPKAVRAAWHAASGGKQLFTLGFGSKIRDIGCRKTYMRAPNQFTGSNFKSASS